MRPTTPHTTTTSRLYWSGPTDWQFMVIAAVFVALAIASLLCIIYVTSRRRTSRRKYLEKWEIKAIPNTYVTARDMGICSPMQDIADSSSEGGATPGRVNEGADFSVEPVTVSAIVDSNSVANASEWSVPSHARANPHSGNISRSSVIGLGAASLYMPQRNQDSNEAMSSEMNRTMTSLYRHWSISSSSSKDSDVINDVAIEEDNTSSFDENSEPIYCSIEEYISASIA